MLHDGHQFHVREAELVQVFGQTRGGLAISERAVVLLRNPHPRAQVQFVNGHRGAQRVGGPSLLHPVGVVPGVFQVPDHGGSSRRLLGRQGDRVGFFTAVPMLGGDNVELVERSFPHARDKTFPDSGAAARLQLVGLRIPPVEAANHRHLASIGRPDAEHGALHSLGLHQVRAHFFVNPVVAALVEQVEILRGQQGDVVSNARGFGCSIGIHSFVLGLV